MVLPNAFGPPAARGALRQRLEDFRVEEELSFALEGAGEHAYLCIRKRGHNTAWVAGELARLAGVAPRDIGWAGLKDRRADAVQWFSVPVRGPEPDWGRIEDGTLELIQVERHRGKLRRGAIACNRFRIRVRELAGASAVLAESLRRVGEQGVPNYFGEQRFGRDQGNLEQARRMLAGELRIRDRHRRGLYLSAARAFVFNEVLAERVRRGDWCVALPGEALMLDGRRAVFRSEPGDEALERRLREHEVHPTGPLAGRGESLASGEAACLEAEILAPHAGLCAGLAEAGLKNERRALRVVPRELDYALGDEVLELGFALPAGSFATAVLREIVDYRMAED